MHLPDGGSSWFGCARTRRIWPQDFADTVVVESDERVVGGEAFGPIQIDALHYVLAATFCDRIVTCDRVMKRIYDLLPEPRGELVFYRRLPGK
jgi:hypothetical protein